VCMLRCCVRRMGAWAQAASAYPMAHTVHHVPRVNSDTAVTRSMCDICVTPAAPKAIALSSARAIVGARPPGGTVIMIHAYRDERDQGCGSGWALSSARRLFL